MDTNNCTKKDGTKNTKSKKTSNESVRKENNLMLNKQGKSNDDQENVEQTEEDQSIYGKMIPRR